VHEGRVLPGSPVCGLERFDAGECCRLAHSSNQSDRPQRRIQLICTPSGGGQRGRRPRDRPTSMKTWPIASAGTLPGPNTDRRPRRSHRPTNKCQSAAGSGGVGATRAHRYTAVRALQMRPTARLSPCSPWTAMSTAIYGRRVSAPNRDRRHHRLLGEGRSATESSVNGMRQSANGRHRPEHHLA